jgi:hypothetical protein
MLPWTILIALTGCAPNHRDFPTKNAEVRTPASWKMRADPPLLAHLDYPGNGGSRAARIRTALWLDGIVVIDGSPASPAPVYLTATLTTDTVAAIRASIDGVIPVRSNGHVAIDSPLETYEVHLDDIEKYKLSVSPLDNAAHSDPEFMDDWNALRVIAVHLEAAAHASSSLRPLSESEAATGRVATSFPGLLETAALVRQDVAGRESTPP